MLSFSRKPPPDTNMAPHLSMIAPTPVISIAAVLFVVIVMSGSAFQGLSHPQMVSDRRYLSVFDVVHI